MIFLSPQNVRIPDNRDRKYFDPARMEELKISIATHGLIHLPVVRESETPGVYFLVAGERRVKAMQELLQDGLTLIYHHHTIDSGLIPVALWQELDTLQAKEIELEENINRTDLSWQERAQAIQGLHELRQKQDHSWTASKTTEEVTGHASNPTTVVTNRVLLARNLHRPAVAKAPDERTALKILKKELQDEFEGMLGRTYAAEAPASPHTVLLIDALAGLQSLPSRTFDVILTDPPYGVNAQNFDAGLITTHDYDDSWPVVQSLLQACIPEMFRVASSQAHLYLFCDILNFPAIKDICAEAGWSVWPRPIIWHKDQGHLPQPDYGPRRMYESILFANKGKKMVTALYEDVVDFPTVKRGNLTHAAQKPVELYTHLLRRSISYPGVSVLDPFCGSGTIFEAAHLLDANATGFDSDPVSVAKSQERMAKC